MDPIKIIFFDIDGTLIDIQKKQISTNTLDLLRRLRENGIRICLATGRSPLTLPDFGGVRFDAYLTFNGSLCFTDREVIFSNPIPAGDVQKLIRNAAALGRPVTVATRDRLAANGTDQDLADYYSIAKLELTVAEDFEDAARREVYQLMMGCREEEYPAILKDVSGARIAAWWDRAADIIPANGGKGIGIERILEYFHLTREEAMAFGDGSNDMEMLRTVGTGVAMENASAQLKEIADDVCGHAAEDGVYHYCLRRGLI